MGSPEKSEETRSDVFDVDRVRQLVELMQNHDLNEIDLRQAGQRLRLRRGDEQIQQIIAPAAAAAPLASAPAVAAPTPPPAPAPAAAAPAASADAEDGDHIVYIKSPMVGTFYSKPNPKSENYVKVGDTVSPDTTVCIIEAMKMFNEIQAEVSGKVVGILVDNEDPVDTNKPLFRVDTRK